MKDPWKWLTLALVAYPVLLAISSALILFVSLHYYQFVIGAKDYKSIYDWDYPASAVGDFNNDGKEDDITSGGCVNFDSKTTFRKPIMCDPYYLTDGYVKKDPRPGLYPHHSYMVKENGMWVILVLDKKFHLTRYEIQGDGTIKKVSPNFLDIIRELIYAVPVFLFYILILPITYLFSIFGRGIILLYVTCLIISAYMWGKLHQPLRKEKKTKTSK